MPELFFKWNKWTWTKSLSKHDSCPSVFLSIVENFAEQLFKQNICECVDLRYTGQDRRVVKKVILPVTLD